MKSFFRKLLGIKDKDLHPEQEIKDIPIESFSDEVDEVPSDEEFAENFTNTGGKFIHCISQDEVLSTLKDIISENNWDEALSFEEEIGLLLNKIDISYSNKTGANSALFTTCEALIANDGSILISSNQLKGRKLSNLPYDFVILAKAERIIHDRSEGLGSIISRYGKNVPSGITTIKGPKTVTGTNNILDSGSLNNSKNIYLLLVE